MNGDGCMLASGQTGSYASVRVWDFESGHCLALFQNHSHSLSSLRCVCVVCVCVCVSLV